MANHSKPGYAGAEIPPLKRGQNTRELFPVGPFGAVLAPVMAIRQTGAIPDDLSAVLLERLPDPDGWNGVIIGQQHAQPVRICVRDQTHFAVAHPLLFEIDGFPVRGVGLINAADRICFFGGLRGRALAPVPTSRYEFASHQILLRRPVSLGKPKPTLLSNRQAGTDMYI